MPDGCEADIPLCLDGGYRLCGIRLIVEDFCPGDWAVLRPWGGSDCWFRQLLCQGELLFGFLSPGDYTLTVYRGQERIGLLVRLPPGGNVEIRCCPVGGSCRWRRDGFHYFFNAL